MHRRIWIVLGGVTIAWLGVGQPEGPGPMVPADFKVMIGSYALGDQAVSTEEIVAKGGRAFLFRSGTSEVVVIDPAKQRIELVDLARKVQAEIPFAMIDQGVAKVAAKLRGEIARREATKARADAVEAQMTGDLAEPNLRRVSVVKPGRLRLINPTIEVEAAVEAEADAARLALELLALKLIARFGAFQAPDDLPPFAELEVISALEADRLRPVEISYLYRLAGPPRRFRRTYRLVTTLTDREREAVARVEQVRRSFPSLDYGRYRIAK